MENKEVIQKMGGFVAYQQNTKVDYISIYKDMIRVLDKNQDKDTY